MIKYELLPTMSLQKTGVKLRSQVLPELVHLEDPAFSVMTDFSLSTPISIGPEESMDEALNEMKVKGVHLLLVVNNNKDIVGLISSEDILGEKPIKIIQENRISRSQILVKMVMVPINKTAAFDIETVQHARVGNIVQTLQSLSTHYALVVQTNENNGEQIIRGLFNTSQISKQLHTNIANSISKAQSVSELQKRKGK